MNLIDTRTTSIYFSCPDCGNKGKAIEIHYAGGINDYGGFVLKCIKCNCEFFLQCQNPSTGMESRVLRGFGIVEILDYEYGEDKKKAKSIKNASNVIVISGEDEFPILKEAWNLDIAFNINEEDKIFICENCDVNMENSIFTNIEENLPIINKFYKDCYPYYIKDYFNATYLIFQSELKCHSCNNKIEHISYSKFKGDGENYSVDDFLIGDLKKFNPKINGLFSREEAKRILEKFILRWNLLASNIIIVSPFIGFDKYIEQKKDKGQSFMDLLDWLLTITDKSKTNLIVRKSEYNKIKEFMSEEIFNALGYYELINPLIEDINEKSVPRFHAKFYAGIIPLKDKCIVEILSGSFNIHRDSKTKENLVFSTLDFSDFNNDYLKPLKNKSKCKSLDNLDVFKVFNNEYNVYKIINREDLWKFKVTKDTKKNNHK